MTKIDSGPKYSNGTARRPEKNIVPEFSAIGSPSGFRGILKFHENNPEPLKAVMFPDNPRLLYQKIVIQVSNKT